MTTSAALHCPVCRSSRIDPAFEASNGYPIVKCAECELVFTDASQAPEPSTLYPHFDQSRGVAVGTLRSALSLFMRRRIELVGEVHRGGRLLDFGCGAGAFARFAASKGYETVGLEPFSLGDTHREPGLTLVQGRLEDVKPSLGRFDVVTLWHVLEHLERPVETLRSLTELLAPGGAFVISVPNFGSLQSALFKGGWFHLDPPRHLLHFTSATLDGCLGRAGLAREREWPLLYEYGVSGWVQSGLNEVLSHRNYLYEIAKDRGALKGTGLGFNLRNLAVSLALGAPLGLVSLPLEAWAARDNRGAALTVSARPVRPGS